MLPAATTLEPLTQGALSSLCGLYSGLNGIRLALYPNTLNRSQRMSLYLHGVEYLSRSRQLKRVLGTGMYHAAWLELTRELLQKTNAAHSSSLTLKPTLTVSAARSRTQSIVRIKADVQRKGPVLICFGDRLNHYTVICGHIGGRLALFDSSRLRWVNSESIGVGENTTRLHWVSQGTTYTIIDDW